MDYAGKYRSWEARSRTRRFRRWVIVGCLVAPIAYFVTAAIMIYPGHDSSRLSGIASCIDALVGLWIGLVLLWIARRGFLQTSLDDRAQMSYGKSFGQLNVMQKDRVKWAAWQDRKTRNTSSDERDTARKREAEARAFRILRRGLPAAIAVYWAVCLSLAPGPWRHGLLISALALSGLVFVVLALPLVLELWSLPDGPGGAQAMPQPNLSGEM